MRRLAALGLAAGLLAGATGILPAAPAGAIDDPEFRELHFPVEGAVSFSDDFGDPRSGGRTHEGNDLMGTKLQRLLAATSGRVTYLKWATDGSLSGNMLTITDAEGWQYRYIHLNNDTPGTDDGLNPREWAFPSTLTQGSRVVAGQLVGFLGDSGNAESTAPHLHFEIRRPDGTALNPYESLKAAVRTPAASGRGIAVNPEGGYYVVTGNGNVHAYEGAPFFGQPTFPYDIARGIAVMPDGLGYVVLDGRGGLHKFGSAATGVVAGFVPPYFPFDIARSVAISPTGEGLAVLDGWGAAHVYGDAPAPPNRYWVGWDIARSVAFTGTGKGLYVLDGWGGVHTSGDAVESLDHPYWMGWDIARAVVAAPGTAKGYAVLDGWGGIFIVGTGLPAVPTGVWAPGNQWRGIALSNGDYLTVSAEGTSRRW